MWQSFPPVGMSRPRPPTWISLKFLHTFPPKLSIVRCAMPYCCITSGMWSQWYVTGKNNNDIHSHLSEPFPNCLIALSLRLSTALGLPNSMTTELSMTIYWTLDILLFTLNYLYYNFCFTQPLPLVSSALAQNVLRKSETAAVQF